MRIAAFLDLSVQDLRERYLTRTTDGRWALIDHPGTNDCIMLTSGGLCRIHSVKPLQCELFPVRWRNNDAIDYCEGLRE